jgi:MerR family Zn(II)-responsive transcriptional regulator of zntA
MTYLKIGELATKTDTSPETLRYYEAQGLIPSPRRSESGYRLYTGADENRVIFIRRARSMGFSLKEVAELLSLEMEKESSTCGEVKSLAEVQLRTIDKKISELESMKAALQQITDACTGGAASAVQCTILGALAAATDSAKDSVKGSAAPRAAPR